MALNDVEISISSGGLGRRFPGTDNIAGIVVNGVAAGSVVLGNCYKLNTLDDAIALGIDADYDADNAVIVYEHIKEFFRQERNGTLYIQVVAKTATMAQMCDPTLTTYAQKLLTFAEGKISMLAIAYNPDTPVADDTALVAAIPKAQLLAEDSLTNHRPCIVILEGAGYDVTDSFDFKAMNAPYVSVVVGQCNDIQQRDTDFAKSAAVGTALGAIAKAAVNESIMWVEKFNVLGDNLSDFRISGILSTALTSSQLNTANDHGFIFFRSHANYAGIYFNDSFTGAGADSDFQHIEEVRTIFKGTRLIRSAMLPSLGSPVTVDELTGFISETEIKAMEARGNRALQTMYTAGEISGPDPSGANPPFQINPAQDVIGTGEILGAVGLIPTGTARKIKLTVGLTNPLNS